MKIHVIVDFMYLYYKYKFTIDSNRIRRLTGLLPYKTDEGVVEYSKSDVSYIYYPIKEIEGFRKQFERDGYEVVLSVCFDSPSVRKDTNTEYKSNRTKKLSDTDFNYIEYIKYLLRMAGYNIYWMEGYEADDIIANLVKQYKNDFYYTVIYTPDTDMLVHIDTKVGVNRYKVGKNYTAVAVSNFSSYCSEEFKCNIPYNALMLYKACVGDKSDVISGISNFGAKAFDKLVDYLNDKGISWNEMGNYKNTMELLNMCSDRLTKQQLDQAIDSLSLVRHMEIEGNLPAPVHVSTEEIRQRAYSQCEMYSLIK